MRMAVFMLLLVASEVLGLAVAEWYYRLFVKVVPPAAVSGFNVGSAHVVFLMYGIAVGLAFFGWAMLVSAIARLMGRTGRRPEPTVAPPR